MLTLLSPRLVFFGLAALTVISMAFAMLYLEGELGDSNREDMEKWFKVVQSLKKR